VGGGGVGVFPIKLQFGIVGMKILGAEMHQIFCILKQVCGLQFMGA